MNKELLTRLENSRSYTMAVAEAMPAHLYHSKPTDGVWNFGELMHHIAYGIEWWTDNYIRRSPADWSPAPLPADKKDIISYLNSAYDYLQSTLDKVHIDEVAVSGFNATIDHTTHHRGQAVLSLRIRGIAAPEYVY